MVLASIRALDDAVVSSILRAVPRGLTIVAPGASDRIIRDPGVVRTPVTGGPYHPDLVAASDLVIAKLGYSTVAEVFCGRARLAYLGRPRFPESPILESFVRAQIPSAPLGSDWLDDETTEQTIERLLEIPRPRGRPRDGAARAARHILDLLDRRT
jgi:hypothetical protein